MNRIQRNIAHILKRHSDWASELDEDPTISQLEQLSRHAGYSLENLLLGNLDAQQLPWNEIKFIFLDVDGVMTDGGMNYTEHGDEFKRFETKDGMAIKKAMDAGIGFGIISSGFSNHVIKHRAKMFGITHVYIGREKKELIAQKWLKELGLSWADCGYIGDDINDREMMQRVAISATPSNGVRSIQQLADFVLNTKGGYGCVREFVEYLPSVKAQL